MQGSELINASYTPLFPSTSPSIAPFKIIGSSHVKTDSGTGFVHCAPAHGAEDYVAFKTLGLLRPHSQLPDSNAVRGSFPIVSHVDWEGRFDASIVDVVGDEVGSGVDYAACGVDQTQTGHGELTGMGFWRPNKLY